VCDAVALLRTARKHNTGGWPDGQEWRNRLFFGQTAGAERCIVRLSLFP
jgi:hypothetical protein